MSGEEKWEPLDRRSRLLRRIVRKGVTPKKLIWVFGYARTGSTWVARMLADLGPNEIWNEPLAGALVGEFVDRHEGTKRKGDFLFSPPYEPVWRNSLREMVLDGADARFPWLPRHGHLIVKEPNGPLGAPFLSAAFPESAFVFLLRDPRDVAASSLNGQMKGGWTQAIPSASRAERTRLAEDLPDDFVRQIARDYVKAVTVVEEAYREHRGGRTLVKYEDLRHEPLEHLRAICKDLGLDTDEQKLREVVEARSWDNIPAELKGDRKVFRKGIAGGWQEDLTARQVEIVEAAASPILREYYE